MLLRSRSQALLGNADSGALLRNPRGESLGTRKKIKHGKVRPYAERRNSHSQAKPGNEATTHPWPFRGGE